MRSILSAALRVGRFSEVAGLGCTRVPSSLDCLSVCYAEISSEQKQQHNKTNVASDSKSPMVTAQIFLLGRPVRRRVVPQVKLNPTPYSGLVLSKRPRTSPGWDWHPSEGPWPKAGVGVSCWVPQACWDPRARQEETKRWLAVQLPRAILAAHLAKHSPQEWKHTKWLCGTLQHHYRL